MGGSRACMWVNGYSLPASELKTSNSGFKFSQLEMSMCYSGTVPAWLTSRSEVVLSVLLSTFKFSLSDKEIGWTMNGIAGPYVKGADKTRPQLPMIMTALEKVELWRMFIEFAVWPLVRDA